MTPPGFRANRLARPCHHYFCFASCFRSTTPLTLPHCLVDIYNYLTASSSESTMRSSARRVMLLFCVLVQQLLVLEAKIYEDGACPLFSLLPFTSRYVLVDSASLITVV